MPTTSPSNSRQHAEGEVPAAESATVDSAESPQTPRKRLRWEDTQTPQTPRVSPRPAVTFDSPTGPKVIHINLEHYIPHMNDIVTEPWVPQKTIAYLYKFLNYYNEEDTRFPIHRVPKTLRWAVVDENPRYMHLTHVNRPLLIWIIAALIDASLVVTAGFPTPRVRVVVDFVRERDRRDAITLYNKAASTTITTMETLVTTSPSSDNEGPQTYDELYDARFKFQDKSKMKQISQSKFNSGDLVLVECTLVVCEGDRPGAKTVSYMLNSLYLLAKKPTPPKSSPLYREPPFPEVFELEL